jgi:hypothetical protein
MKEHNTKTNAQWYPYEDQGSYFRLKDGVLLFCPMLRDGSRGSDEEIGEVDWHRGVEGEEDRARLLTIVKELQHKQ